MIITSDVRGSDQVIIMVICCDPKVRLLKLAIHDWPILEGTPFGFSLNQGQLWMGQDWGSAFVVKQLLS